MRRKIADIEDLPVDDLPELTAQQYDFVRHILEGKKSAEAYRASYSATNMLQTTIWVEASRLRNHPKIALWIAAARKACMGNGKLTLEEHLEELNRLKEVALATGNVGAAVQAEQLRGKAVGHYTERVEVTDLTDIRAELEEIKKVSPELAEAYAKAKGISLH